MKITDLRTGNLVLANHLTYNSEIEKPFYITQVDADLDFLIGYTSLKPNLTPKRYVLQHLKHTKPIPLTKKYLSSLGFKKQKNDIPTYYKNFGKTDGTYQYCFRIFQDANNDYYQECFGKKVVITSVHQLQNLYFAVTGEELTINKM